MEKKVLFLECKPEKAILFIDFTKRLTIFY